MKYHTFDLKIDSLGREATAYVYLPESYHTSDNHYPVLYMHDAHNLFDDATASYGNSWKIIEAFEQDKTLPEIIVCGINCGDGMVRLDEYSPFVDTTLKGVYDDWITRDVGGKGDVYLDFLSQEFKGIIDSKYRTKPQREYTAIAGSSMGGLISIYAAYAYQETYSRVAAVSTAYFFATEEMFEFMKRGNLDNIITFYADCGDDEQSGETATNQVYLETNAVAADILRSKLEDKFMYKVIKGGIHSETSWSNRVGEIIKYLYSDYKE